MSTPIAERDPRSLGAEALPETPVDGNGHLPLERPISLLDLAQEVRQFSHEDIYFEPNSVEPYVLLDDAFNTTRFRIPGKGEYAIARRLNQQALQPHGIDFNTLVVYKLENGVPKELHELELESPKNLQGKIINWEDVRVIVTDDNTIVLGVTAVRESPSLPKVKDLVHPAIVKAHIDETGERLVVDGEPLVFPEIIAKNITPIAHREGKILVLGRIDDSQHTHTLSVMEVEGENNASSRLRMVGEIQVPKMPWNDTRIGTAGTELIVMPNGDVWLPIHYQQLAGENRIIYRLGILRQKANGEVDVSRPVFEREDFEHIVPRDVELHPDGKTVVYSCSHEKRNGGIEWTVTVGDQKSVTGVYKSLEELQEYFPQN